MKKSIFKVLGLSVVLLMSACKSEGTHTEVDDVPAEQNCTYVYNEGATTLEWTAYKTTGKIGVSGGFNDIQVSSETGSSPEELLESISFIIETSSVETNNEERNAKVANHFFNTINTAQITGEIKSVSEGQTVMSITMNGITLDIEGESSLNEGQYTFESDIDVQKWNGLPGIEALNEVCKDLHTGEDGVSKLWSEVHLSFSTRIKEDCH